LLAAAAVTAGPARRDWLSSWGHPLLGARAAGGVAAVGLEHGREGSRPCERGNLVKKAIALLGCVSVGILAADRVSAVNFAVTSAADGHDAVPGDGMCGGLSGCTLRAAVEESNALPGPDAVGLDTASVALTLGPIEVSGEVSIEGLRSKQTVVVAAKTRQFSITPNGSATLENVALVNGYDSERGGCVLNEGTLVLRQTKVERCYAVDAGGGVYNTGSLVIQEGSVFAQSRTFSGGGIFNAGTVRMEDTYFYHNGARGADTDHDGKGDTAGGGSIVTNTAGATFVAKRSSFMFGQARKGLGGGILNLGGVVDLENATLAKNRCRRCEGGAIVSYGGRIDARFTTVDRTQSAFLGGVILRAGAVLNADHVLIVGHNTSTEPDFACFSDGSATVNATGPSMDDALAGFTDGCPGFIHVQDGGTHGYKNRGGAVPTVALSANSPARDAGAATCSTLEDARGQPRPAGIACDIGAYEVQ